MTTTGTDDEELEFDFTQNSSASVAENDSSEDIALLWDDLPIPNDVGLSPTLPVHDLGVSLLQGHNIDEYFIDNEGDWTQDGDNGWAWRAAEPLLDFGDDKLGAYSDLEEFTSDSSQDLHLARPLSQSKLSQPPFTDTHNYTSRAQADFKRADLDLDLDSAASSQDVNVDAYQFVITSNAPGYPKIETLQNLERRSSSLPISESEPPSIFAKHGHESPRFESSYLDHSIIIDMDSNSDSGANSDILHHFGDNVPERHSSPLAALTDEHIPNKSITSDPVDMTDPVSQADFDMRTSETDLIDNWSEEGLLDFDM